MLERTSADLSPLDFSQRYAGTLTDDGRAIRGVWETSKDGEHWTKDFELMYVSLQ